MAAPRRPAPTIAPSGAPWTTTVLADHPLVGRIYRPAEGAFGDRAALERAVRRAPYVLLGEKHDNPDHHRLQLELLEVVLEGGGRPAEVMEMLDTEVEAKLARFLESGSQDPDALAAAVGWNDEGWPWELYRPLIARGLEKRLPIVAANLSRQRARTIVMNGGAAEVLADLELPALSDAQRAALAQEIRDSHCGKLPEEMVPAMALAQRARDALMGSVLRRAGAAAGRAVLIAGGGHVRADRGAPLAAQLGRDRMVVVSFVEVARGETDPAQYLGNLSAFDFVWFTPRLDDDDPCEKLRDHFDKADKGS